MLCNSGSASPVLERCIFKHRASGVYLVADAYEGSQIRAAVIDFLSAAAGRDSKNVSLKENKADFAIRTGGADLVVYVGHDGFMDFQVPPVVAEKGTGRRQVIVLACASKSYFGPYLKQTGAKPILWTTGLMAPEAYTLKAAIDGWIAGEPNDQIQLRAAQAYNKYQKCGERAALRLLVSD